MNGVPLLADVCVRTTPLGIRGRVPMRHLIDHPNGSGAQHWNGKASGPCPLLPPRLGRSFGDFRSCAEGCEGATSRGRDPERRLLRVARRVIR